MNRSLKIFLIIFGVIILTNFSVLDFFLVRDKFFLPGEATDAGKVIDAEAVKVATDSCSLVCQQTIVEKITEELSRLPLSAGQSPVPSDTGPPSVPKVVQPINGNRSKVVYIPLTTEGKTVLTTWTDIVPSEFYFDLSNYPNAREVRFETYLLALHGSAKVYARLYDATNKRGIDYSELETQSDSFTRLESPAITIWRGNNKYTVQLRSVNGAEVQLKEAKLKVLY